MARYMTADGTRIGKPSMTDLPYELGIKIIGQILSTTKPDFSNTEAEVRRGKEFMREQRKKRVTEELCNTVLCLPIHPYFEDAKVEFIASTLKAAILAIR